MIQLTQCTHMQQEKIYLGEIRNIRLQDSIWTQSIKSNKENLHWIKKEEKIKTISQKEDITWITT